MQHDIKSAGGRIATDSAKQSGVKASDKPLRRRPRDPQRLSFVTEWETPRHNWVHTDYFEVPAGNCHEASVSGYVMAREFVEWMLDGTRRNDFEANCVMRRAYALAGQCDGEPAMWAARAFTDVCTKMLIEGAKSRIIACVNEKIAEHQRSALFMAQRELNQRRAFVARMRAAKLAKSARQDKSAEVCHG